MSSGRNASAYLHPICLQMYWAGQSLLLPFLLSLHIFVLVLSPVFYFLPFPFPSPLLLVPLASHPLLISSLVFLPLSANTYRFRCLLYSTRNAIHTINQWKRRHRFSSVPKDNICQYRRQHSNKYECFAAVSSGVTCYFSVCVARIRHTHR